VPGGRRGDELTTEIVRTQSLCAFCTTNSENLRGARRFCSRRLTNDEGVGHILARRSSALEFGRCDSRRRSRLKAAGGGSYGSRWCERSKRPPVSICSSRFDPVRGRGVSPVCRRHTETLRDPCRGRNSDITQISGGRSLALAPPATVRVASGDFASSSRQVAAWVI